VKSTVVRTYFQYIGGEVGRQDAHSLAQHLLHLLAVLGTIGNYEQRSPQCCRSKFS
jgi:hypothetical protein